GRVLAGARPPLEYRRRMTSYYPLLEAYAPRGPWWAFTEGARLRIARFDGGTGPIIHHERWHLSPISALAFDAAGKRMATVDEAQGLHLWDAGSAEQRIVDTRDAGENVKGVLFTPDGGQVIQVEHSGRVHLWDTRTGKLVRSLVPATTRQRRGTSAD